MSPGDRPAVLVVGAGPTGLVLACELARRQVPIRLIDRLPIATTQSRAIVVHARSLEMLERLGAVEEVIASGVRSVAMEMHASGDTIARIGLDTVDSPYPYSITTAQTETERILAHRLAQLGGAVERGVELVSFDQEQSGVTAILRHAGGTEERASAAWIVGTDGAHSTVREAMGTRLEGSFKGERFLLGDVEADYDLPRDSMHTYFAPAGPLLVFPMLGRRVRLIAEITDEQGAGAEDESIERLQRLVDARAGGMQLLSSHWITVFEIHHAQAPVYRSGRAFIAGDAAHVHSPAGGQGMNTGMQDAFNLGWKLAPAAKGKADEELLDSYQAERHPVAQRVISSTTLLTRAGTLRGKLQQIVRNHAAQVATGFAPLQHLLASQTEETSLNYRGSPIVAGHRRHGHLQPGDNAPDVPGTDLRRLLTGDCRGHVALSFTGHRGAATAPRAEGIRNILVGESPAGAAGFDGTLPDVDGAIAKRYGLEQGGIAVVRPDGYIGFLGDLGDAAGLQAYLSRFVPTAG